MELPSPLASFPKVLAPDFDLKSQLSPSPGEELPVPPSSPDISHPKPMIFQPDGAKGGK